MDVEAFLNIRISRGKGQGIAIDTSKTSFHNFLDVFTQVSIQLVSIRSSIVHESEDYNLRLYLEYTMQYWRLVVLDQASARAFTSPCYGRSSVSDGSTRGVVSLKTEPFMAAASIGNNILLIDSNDSFMLDTSFVTTTKVS
jgi:hypothetical protein